MQEIATPNFYTSCSWGVPKQRKKHEYVIRPPTFDGGTTNRMPDNSERPEILSHIPYNMETSAYTQNKILRRKYNNHRVLLNSNEW